MDSDLLTHLYGTEVEVVKTPQGDMFVRPDPAIERRRPHLHTPLEAAEFHSDGAGGIESDAPSDVRPDPQEARA